MSAAARADPCPHLLAAGQIAASTESTAEAALKPDLLGKPPPTPEYMQKWRKDAAPGRTCLHPGVADDKAHQRVHIYGRAEPVGVKVHEVLNTAPKSHLIEKAIEKKEGIYLSHKREPLGKAYKRGHQLPGHVLETGFGFPTPQDVSGEQSKELLHPPELLEPAEEHALYVKSHADFAPGEQRHRGYKWVDKQGHIDPASFSFGGDVKARQIDGVAKALNPGLDAHHKAAPVVVEKLLEDFREVAGEPLGRVKTLGHGQFTSPDQVFGLPSQKGAEWGVRQCIGNYSAEDQAPDKDLGRSIRPGWRNTAPPERMFGVPTIRNDVPAPGLKSITDHQNYGDEAGAAKLLYPPRFSDEGISDEDFLLARSQQEIATIFAGFGLDDGTLAATYEQAATMDADGLVSVEGFRRVLNACA